MGIKICPKIKGHVFQISSPMTTRSDASALRKRYTLRYKLIKESGNRDLRLRMGVSWTADGSSLEK
jgi:hypothetical protein